MCFVNLKTDLVLQFPVGGASGVGVTGPLLQAVKAWVTLPALSQTWIMLILLMDVICR